MKKNAMLKIAAILMVAVLLTTCAISSTFAKYTTTANTQTTSARVANWGVELNVAAPTLFKTSYSKGSDVMAASADSAALIIAPGTANDGTNAFKFSVKSASEVRYKLSANIDVSLAGWAIGSSYYCPVIVKVNGTPVTAPAAGTSEGMATYEANIEKAIVTALFGKEVTANTGTTVYEQTYAPGDTTFATVKEVYVTWEWPFSTTGNDANDTALGNAATKATIGFSCGLTAEQVGAGAPETPAQYAK